jgi:hypothetical protein
MVAVVKLADITGSEVWFMLVGAAGFHRGEVIRNQQGRG